MAVRKEFSANFYILAFCAAYSFFCSTNLLSQTRITGTVKEPSGAVVADLYVIASQPGSKILIAFSATDSNGEFSLNFTSAHDSIQIKTSRLDYAETSILVQNKNQHINLIVSPQATNLSEIVIRPEAVKRRGDTLNFFVQRFVSAQDRSIGDVIRKLPGIEVLPSGQIQYQGKAINEFMVESLDLMGGRYNGIVNNLTYDDVATVQILENHEPIRAKRDISNSDRAAINLKLKEGSKNKYLISFALGAGASPLLWDNEVSLMQFAVRKQTNVVYKGNNVGKMIDGELSAFYGNSGTGNESGLLSVPGSKPPISNTQRYLDNNANTININRLYAVGKYSTLSFQGDYLIDRQSQSSVFNTFYILGKDSTLLISERTKQDYDINKANLSVIYRDNSPAFFLNNIIKGHGAWNSTGALISNSKEINQNLSFNDLSVSNSFSLLKVLNKNRLEVKSIISYGRNDEELSVRNGVKDRDYLQTLERDNFSALNSISYGGKRGKLSYDITAGADYKSGGLKSNLNIDGQAADSLKNNIRLNDLRIYITPSVRYAFERIVFNAQLPVSYNQRKLINNSSSHFNTDVTDSKKGFFVNPSLGFRYDPSNVLRVSFSVGRDHNRGDINTLNKNYILTNYRTLSRGAGIWPEDTVSRVYLGFIINRAEKFSSTYLTFSYSYRASNIIVSQDFNDIMLYRYILPLPVHSGLFNTTMMYSKGFDVFLRKATFTPSYSINNSRQVQNGKEIRNNTATFSLSLSLEMRLWEDSDLRYYVGWSNSLSKNRREGIEIASSLLNSLSQTLSFQTLIYKNVHLKAAAEHRKLFSAGSSIPSTFFLDSDIIYKRKRAEYSIAFSNILNSQDYAVKYLGSFSNSENLYALRARSVMFRVKFSL